MQKHRTKIRLIAVIGAVVALGVFASSAAGDTAAPFWPQDTGALGGTSETYADMKEDGSYHDPSLGRRVSVDDNFRDAAKVATHTGDRVVDDREWFRNGAKVPAPRTNPGIVDDEASSVSVPQSGPNGFDWGDFGIGAAAMLGLMLVVAGFGVGAFAVHHRGGQLKTS